MGAHTLGAAGLIVAALTTRGGRSTEKLHAAERYLIARTENCA